MSEHTVTQPEIMADTALRIENRKPGSSDYFLPQDKQPNSFQSLASYNKDEASSKGIRS